MFVDQEIACTVLGCGYISRYGLAEGTDRGGIRVKVDPV